MREKIGDLSSRVEGAQGKIREIGGYRESRVPIQKQGVIGSNRGNRECADKKQGIIGSVPGPVRLPNFPSQYRNTSFRSFWNKYKKDRTISVRSLIGYQLCLYILLKQLIKQLMQLIIKICKPISALTLLGVRDSLMARLSRLLIQGLIEILKHGLEFGGRNHCSLS